MSFVSNYVPTGAVWICIIPSLLGFLLLGGLALMALTLGRRRGLDYLFAAICAIGAIINIDLALINLIPDERTPSPLNASST